MKDFENLLRLKKREKIKLYPKIIYRLNVELEKDEIYAIRKQSNLRYA